MMGKIIKAEHIETLRATATFERNSRGDVGMATAIEMLLDWYEAQAAAPAPPNTVVDGYYLVRIGDRDEHRFWCAGQTDPERSSAWTTNRREAILFARIGDALDVQTRMMKGMRGVRPVSSRLFEVTP